MAMYYHEKGKNNEKIFKHKGTVSVKTEKKGRKK